MTRLDCHFTWNSESVMTRWEVVVPDRLILNRLILRGALRTAGVGAIVLLAVTTIGGCAAQPQHGLSPRPRPTKPPAMAWSIHSENQIAGTPNWRMGNLGKEHDIEGWADASSIMSGQSVGLHVSTTSTSYTIHAVRMGWYGGIEGREIWSSEVIPGVAQPAPQFIAATSTVATTWPVSTTVSTVGWPPGDYLFRLDSSAGPQRYIPLQIREETAAGKVVIVSADTTWQAYNQWGGYSLYAGSNGSYTTRSRAVSFDRPYGISTGQGASEYMENMEPLVSLTERMGVNVDYVSDVDLDENPHVLDGARAVVLTGHDEYWSSSMRQMLIATRDGGTNLAFLGANEGYRHIRFQASSSGVPERIEVCFKEAAQDPLFGVNNPEVTSQWRNPPDPRPESIITGVYYQSNPVKADMVVVDPAIWLLAGTNASSGLRLPGVVNPEYDRVDTSVPTPRPIEIITHSPVNVEGRSDYSDSAYYTVPSGAGVFAAGTIAWINSLNGVNGPESAAFVATVTANLLAAFSKGPAGLLLAATDNVGKFYTG